MFFYTYCIDICESPEKYEICRLDSVAKLHPIAAESANPEPSHFNFCFLLCRAWSSLTHRAAISVSSRDLYFFYKARERVSLSKSFHQKVSHNIIWNALLLFTSQFIFIASRGWRNLKPHQFFWSIYYYYIIHTQASHWLDTAPSRFQLFSIGLEGR